MALEPVRRTTYYRRAQFSDSVTHTLQQLLSNALHTQKKISDRQESLDPQARSLRVISSHESSSSFICGRLTFWERGAYQAVMDDDPNATTLALDALEPPKKAGKQQQFIPGILYFAVHKNHVALVQSSALRATALESHFLWLLRSRLRLLTSEQGMVLVDEPTKATRERIRKSHVRSVMVGRPLMDEHPATGEGRRKTSRFKITDDTVEWLEGFLGKQAFDKLGLEDKVFDSNLEVWLEIRYPKHQRSKPAAAMKLLDDLGIALRDIDEDQARLKLEDGSIVHGKELKIMSHVETSVTKGLLDEAALYEGMRKWVRNLVQTGQVDPD